MKVWVGAVLAHCVYFFSVVFTGNVGISSYFLYFHWYLKKDVTRTKFGTRTQTRV